MLPPAPARFSTTTVWPNSADNLTEIVRAAESVPPHPPVWAFYYAWYDTPAGPKARWSFWADKQEAGKATRWLSPAQPLIGAYDSTHVATTAWHLQLADAAGIDAFLVSWWGGANTSGQAFETVILPAAAKTKVKVALNCELAQFHAEVPKLAEQLSGILLRTKGHPGYLHVDGRPVVYLYQVPFAPKLTPATFTQLRTAVEKRAGPVWWAMDKIAYQKGSYGVPAAWRQTPGIDALGFYGTFSVKRISTEAELTPFFRNYAAALGDGVQLLDRFSLHIRVAGRSKNVDQSGAPKILRNELADKTDLGQQTGKFSRRPLVGGLTLNDKAV